MPNLNLPQHILDLNPELVGAAKRGQLSQSAYRSGLEAKVARDWCPVVLKPGWRYEAIKLRLPGGAWYTPDFFGELMHGGGPALIEVKGWTKSLRADKRNYNAALELNPWAHWCWLEEQRGQWVEKWNETV